MQNMPDHTNASQPKIPFAPMQLRGIGSNVAPTGTCHDSTTPRSQLSMCTPRSLMSTTANYNVQSTQRLMQLREQQLSTCRSSMASTGTNLKKNIADVGRQLLVTGGRLFNTPMTPKRSELPTTPLLPVVAKKVTPEEDNAVRMAGPVKNVIVRKSGNMPFSVTQPVKAVVVGKPNAGEIKKYAAKEVKCGKAATHKPGGADMTESAHQEVKVAKKVNGEGEGNHTANKVCDAVDRAAKEEETTAEEVCVEVEVAGKRETEAEEVRKEVDGTLKERISLKETPLELDLTRNEDTTAKEGHEGADGALKDETRENKVQEKVNETLKEKTALQEVQGELEVAINGKTEAQEGQGDVSRTLKEETALEEVQGELEVPLNKETRAREVHTAVNVAATEIPPNEVHEKVDVSVKQENALNEVYEQKHEEAHYEHKVMEEVYEQEHEDVHYEQNVKEEVCEQEHEDVHYEQNVKEEVCEAEHEELHSQQDVKDEAKEEIQVAEPFREEGAQVPKTDARKKSAAKNVGEAGKATGGAERPMDGKGKAHKGKGSKGKGKRPKRNSSQQL